MNVIRQIQWVKAQLTALVGQASRGKSAELYAEVMLDNLPPFITPDDIAERIGAPDAIAQLAKLEPRVLQHAAWFEEFRKAVNEYLTDTDEPEAPEARTIAPSADLDNPDEH